MIVLAENNERLPPSASARDIVASAEAARLVGARVYAIEPDFSRCRDAEGALAHVPPQAVKTPALWVGYIPSLERYQALYDTARATNIVLINDPAQHQRAQELDAGYPLLTGLTPKTTFVTTPEEKVPLSFPVFVKGAVQSRKSRGWRTCVAETPEELAERVAALLSLENRSRGRVAVRELVPLRHTRIGPGEFPLGREFRCFLLHGQIVGWGYYWEGDDPLAILSPEEAEVVFALAREAAARLDVPYISVDIGQSESGDWLVIETGDGQFSGLSQTPRLALWQTLKERLTCG
jgi:hypothetical protein